MKTHFQTPYTDDGGMRFFTGYVESRNDPMQLGRVQVRIIGFHTDDKSLIPTEDLPWASPLNPINSASVSGVGSSPTGMMEGTMVVGFWGDWPDCQIPMVLGTLNLQEGFGGGLFGPYNGMVGDMSPLGPGTISPHGDGPKWLQIARGELQKSIREIPGAAHNPEVLKYGKEIGFTTDDGEHPWCAAFARWCLKETGVSVKGLTGAAKSFTRTDAMEQLDEPIYGCIVVQNRGPNPAKGHVGFFTGRTSGSDLILGGNQGNAVSIKPYGLRNHFGYYWPAGVDKGSNGSTFEGVQGLLDLIGSIEAPAGYAQVYGGTVLMPPQNITTMTVNAVLTWMDSSVAAGSASSASGRFQFIRSTLRAIRDAGIISGNDLMNKSTQDTAAMYLLEQRGLSQYVSGAITAEQFANRLSQEWASLPVVTGPNSGRSYYAGDGLNHALTTPATILAAIRSIVA